MYTTEVAFQDSMWIAGGCNDAFADAPRVTSEKVSGVEGSPCAMHVRPAGARQRTPAYANTARSADGFRRAIKHQSFRRFAGLSHERLCHSHITVEGHGESVLNQIIKCNGGLPKVAALVYRDNMRKQENEPKPPLFKHLSVQIRADIYKRAKATSVMTDVRFARFVERALLVAVTTSAEKTP